MSDAKNEYFEFRLNSTEEAAKSFFRITQINEQCISRLDEIVFSNTDNISYLAFVVDENNNVINTRAAGGNEDQAFEENP